MKPLTNLKKIHEIQQFYYREARMLDERKFQSWLDLLAPGIEYSMPARGNCGANAALKNCEEMLDLSPELSEGLAPPLRDDNLLTLTFRANRTTSALAVADNPLTRTRRSVNNIEVYRQGGRAYRVYNNVIMSFSRHGQDNHQYSFQRQDVLVRSGGALKIRKRRIIVEWNVITAPTMALIF